MTFPPARRTRRILACLALTTALVGGCAAAGNTSAQTSPVRGSSSVSSTPAASGTDRATKQVEQKDPTGGDGVRRAPRPVRALKARPGDARPNIVLFLLDDMRADELKYMSKTRSLIEANGINFSNAVSPHPLCCPARAELVSGQYGQNNGVHHNQGPLGGFKALKHPENTVATWLHNSGYTTSYTGKYLNSYGRTNGVQPGWDLWDPLVGNVSRYTRFEFYNGDRYGFDGTDDYVSHRVASRVDQSVRRLAGPGDPFFMFINHTAPHRAHPDQGEKFPSSMYKGESRGEEAGEAPPIPEPKYAKSFSGERSPVLSKPSFRNTRSWGKKPQDNTAMQAHFLARIRSLQSADDAVAQTIATLRQTGELDNTYLVFTSDNGFAIGEHGYNTKNVLMREVLDVPLLIAGPGVGKGTRNPKIASLVDLPATFLDMAGVSVNHPLDGRSLMPFARGQNPRWRDTTLVQTGGNNPGARYPGWVTRGVQTTRYLYVSWVNKNPSKANYEALYDRKKDPYEMRDVAESPRYAAVTREMRKRTERLGKCTGAVKCNHRFGPPPEVR